MKITILILFSLFLGSEALGQQPGSNPKRLPNGQPMSWPRFLWTPHCPLEPRRNGPHEGQFS